VIGTEPEDEGLLDALRAKIEPPFTQEEQDLELVALAQLYRDDRIAYDRRVREKRHRFGQGATLKGIEARVRAILAADKGEAEDVTIANELIVLAKRNALLWHDDGQDSFASFERDGHIEHHRIDRRGFRDWLSDKYGETHKIEIEGVLEPKYPTQADLKEAEYQIENYARRGDQIEPDLRVIEHDGEVWIDSGDRNWKAYHVGSAGWREEPRMEAPLIRADGMKALPVPERGGNIRELQPFLNFPPEYFVLYCGNLATVLNPFGSQLTTVFWGPPGSAKTTATRIFRALTDPNKIDTRRAASVRDLMHGVTNTRIVALENVSHVSEMSSRLILSYRA
jgi:hypothetical protein